MKRFRAGLVALALALGACALPQQDGGAAAARQQLAPTGKLRAGINVGPSANVFRASPDPATKRPRGVAVDLALALGERLEVPVELLPYPSYKELLAAAARGEFDVTFLPFDTERARVLAFGPAYYRLELTYLVSAPSGIHAVADVDRPGMRVAAVERSVTAQNRQKALKNAKLLQLRSLDEVRDHLRDGKADAAAGGRESMVSLAAQVPGTRVLEESFDSTAVAIAVLKDRPAALAYASDFIESAKASGLVRRAFDGAGFKDAAVAPPSSGR
jgi:polar amino acid transport system substrate-binding protein